VSEQLTFNHWKLSGILPEAEAHSLRCSQVSQFFIIPAPSHSLELFSNHLDAIFFLLLELYIGGARSSRVSVFRLPAQPSLPMIKNTSRLYKTFEEKLLLLGPADSTLVCSTLRDAS
jgi:hypothetical protein